MASTFTLGRESDLRIRRQRWIVAAVFVRGGISENKLQRKLGLARRAAADLGSICSCNGFADFAKEGIDHRAATGTWSTCSGRSARRRRYRGTYPTVRVRKIG